MNENLLHKFIVYLKKNYLHTKIHNPKDISDPIVEAIKNKKHEVIDPDDISAPIVDTLKQVQHSIESTEYPTAVSIKEADILKSGLSEINETLKQEIKKLDKEVVVKNNLTELFGLFKKSGDKRELLKALKQIEKKIPTITPQEIPDYTSELTTIASKLNFDVTPVVSKLQELIEKPENKTLELPDELFDQSANGKEKYINVSIRKGGIGGGLWDGQIRNTQSEQVNPATEEKQDDIVTAINNISGGTTYTTNEFFESGTDTYFCKESSDGDWYIKKLTSAGIWGHATETNNPTVTTYTDARTNYATLTYGNYSDAF